jgi:hypothetical protein
VVTELQAHSWPELYFPGYGWIPFEPTPALPPGERVATAASSPPLERLGHGPADLDAGLTELRQLASAAAATSTRIVWAQRALAGLNGLLAGWLIVGLCGWWLAWRYLPAGGQAAVGYARLARWAARLGRPLRPAETATEYAAAVTQAANATSAQSRLARRSAAVAAAVVRRETPHLAHALESALYAPSPDSSPAPSLPSAGAVRTDRRLWSALRRLWLARWGM